MVNEVYHAVEERNVVRNEDEGVFVVDEISLQPFDVVFIQIVGRFVQQKDVRFFQQQFTHEDFGALTAGKLCDVFIQTDVCQTQCTTDFFHFGINDIEVMMFQQFLNAACFFHQEIHPFFVGFCHFRIIAVHLGFQIEEKGKGGLEYIPNGLTFFQYGVLI